jgi:N-carbamoyl-L-amino-acid hydrolase
VVLGALGQKWFDLKLRGVEAHAGPTPMHLRKDALVGAAVMVGAVNRAALGHQPHACGTVGCLQAYPGSRNVIPGEVRMTLDFRHLEPAAGLDDRRSARVIEATCEEHGLTYELTPTADFPPLYFDKGCVEAVRECGEGLGLSHMDIVSGAGHDAIFLAELGPAGMIFVPCEGGISHNEIENAAPDDLAAGCAVLLRAMLAASAMVAEGQRAA